MYKLCKTEESAARQHSLEQGLLQLMCAHRYEDISVSDLCQRMEIPRKSFYRYFASKDGALRALLDHTLMEYEHFNVVYKVGDRRTLRKELEKFFLFWLKQKKLLDALQRSGMSGILIEHAISYALSNGAISKRFLPEDSRETQEQVMMFGVCGLMSMVVTWHHDGYPQSVGELATIAERLLAQPLFPNVERFF